MTEVNTNFWTTFGDKYLSKILSALSIVYGITAQETKNEVFSSKGLEWELTFTSGSDCAVFLDFVSSNFFNTPPAEYKENLVCIKAIKEELKVSYLFVAKSAIDEAKERYVDSTSPFIYFGGTINKLGTGDQKSVNTLLKEGGKVYISTVSSYDVELESSTVGSVTLDSPRDALGNSSFLFEYPSNDSGSPIEVKLTFKTTTDSTKRTIIFSQR